MTYNLQEALVFCYHVKKTAAESLRLLVEAFSEWTCSWENTVFWVIQKIGPYWLKIMLKLNRNSQNNRTWCSKRLLFVWKLWDRCRKGENGFHTNWVKNSKQIYRPVVVLLARYRRKLFIHRIVAGDEKQIYFEHVESPKSWVNPGYPSTYTARANRFGKKTMFCGGIRRVSSIMSC